MKDFLIGFHEMLTKVAESFAQSSPQYGGVIRLAPVLLELVIVVVVFQKLFAVFFGRSEAASDEDPHAVKLPRARLSNGKMIEARLNEDGSIKGWAPIEDVASRKPPRIIDNRQPLEQKDRA